ncbi:MAG: hypothetical protein K0R08_2079 [Solimicrobium sp.]|nr:hypothetical protein [Solimicrobium sp.]
MNCGPNTIQKIKNGEFTIEQAKNEMQEKMPSALQIYKELIQKWPEKEWVLNSFKIKNRFIKYFIDGSLTIEQSDLWNLIYYFLDKVQKYLDNGQMSLGWYLDLKTGDQWYFQEILENEKIQEGLNNRKITIQQLIKLDFYYFSYVIKDEIIQKCLENNDLTLEQLVNLPHYFKFFRVLTEERVQPLLLSKKLTIEQLLTCTPAGYDVLRHPHGTDAIFQGKITVEQVLKSTDEQYKILNSGNSDGVNKYVRALNNDNCIIS